MSRFNTERVDASFGDESAKRRAERGGEAARGVRGAKPPALLWRGFRSATAQVRRLQKARGTGRAVFRAKPRPRRAKRGAPPRREAHTKGKRSGAERGSAAMRRRGGRRGKRSRRREEATRGGRESRSGAKRTQNAEQGADERRRPLNGWERESAGTATTHGTPIRVAGHRPKRSEGGRCAPPQCKRRPARTIRSYRHFDSAISISSGVYPVRAWP